MSSAPQLDAATRAKLEADSKAPILQGVILTGFLLSFLVVSLRFYVRSQMVKKVGADDWWSLVSFVNMAACFSLQGVATLHGLGSHAILLEPADLSYAMKLTWIAFVFTPWAEAASKISVAVLLSRITTQKFWKWTFRILIGVNIVATTAMIFSVLLACIPIQMLWDPTVPGHCNVIQRDVLAYIQGIVTAVSDLVLAVAPISILWNVQISRKSKFLLCGLLSICFFTAAAGFVRVAYTYETYVAEVYQDPTWYIMDFINWKDSEISLSVIVGCLPCLRPLFDRNAWCRQSQPQTYSIGSLGPMNSKSGMNITKLTEIQVQYPGSERRGSSSSSDGAPVQMMQVQYTVPERGTSIQGASHGVHRPTFLTVGSSRQSAQEATQPEPCCNCGRQPPANQNDRRPGAGGADARNGWYE